MTMSPKYEYYLQFSLIERFNMKKLILIMFLLTSCSLNNDSAYWNENLNLNYEELKYDKDYTFDEYGKILEKYSAKNKTPKIN